MPIYDISGNMIYSGVFNPSFAGSDCRNAFIAEMNKKAAGIGMASSNFITPSGATVNEYTTAKDMALLTMIASGYRQLAEVWSKNSYTISPRGGTAVTVNSTVQDATLEAAYPILGGKTGSISGHMNLACLCNVNGEQVAGYIAGASSEAARFSAMKQLMDIAADVLEGNTPSGSVTDATSAMAIRVPTYYPMNYEQQPADELYAQNENTSIVPASTTKILASLVLLDWAGTQLVLQYSSL